MGRVDILGVSFDAITLNQLIDELAKKIEAKNSSMLVTANSEIVMLARKDEEFKNIVNSVEFVTADGVGIIIASNINGHPLPERVTGIDIVGKLFEIAQQKKYSFYFLGAKEGVAQKAAKEIKKKYPEIRIVGIQHGYFKNEAKVIEDIKQKEPDILLVALGMGRQEKWIYKYKDELKVPLSIGVGGSFDVLAGNAKRAPVIMQRLGLEWLFRLVQEPSRLGRMMVLPLFLFEVIKTKLKGVK